MDTESFQGLNDILLLHSSVDNSGVNLSWTVFSWLLILAIILLILQYVRQPLHRIRRQLLWNQISTREAAHRLAQSIELNAVQTAKLEQIRFAKTEPTLQQVLDLMKVIESKKNDG